MSGELAGYEQLLKDTAVLNTQMGHVLAAVEIMRGDLRDFIECQQEVNTEREKRLTKIEERQEEHDRQLEDSKQREKRLVAVESRLNGHDLDKYKLVITVLSGAGGVISAIVIGVSIAALKTWLGF